MFYTQTLCHEPWEFLWNYFKTRPTNLFAPVFMLSHPEKKLNKQKKLIKTNTHCTHDLKPTVTKC